LLPDVIHTMLAFKSLTLQVRIVALPVTLKLVTEILVGAKLDTFKVETDKVLPVAVVKEELITEA
jgi:hypothetical protein